MQMPETIDSSMIAPCGVNCLACGAHLDTKKPCPGCRALEESHIRKSCRNCVKKKCCYEKGYQWCFECDRFPCARIKSLNVRYTRNYDVDLVRNGMDAKADIDAFLAAQKKRFRCEQCDGVVDQHHKKCSECNATTIHQ